MVENMISCLEPVKREIMPDIHFTDIFKTYQKPIYNYVLRMVRNQDTAEELTQEIFIKTYKNLSSFRGESKLSTWIYGIATNTCLDHFRSSDFKKGEKTGAIILDVLPEEADSEGIKKILSIDEGLIKTEMAECIRDYIEGLSKEYRTVIILHDLEGFKNREIAKLLGCTLDTVKIRLHRARKKLQSILALNCNFYHDENNVLHCDRKTTHDNGDNNEL